MWELTRKSDNSYMHIQNTHYNLKFFVYIQIFRACGVYTLTRTRSDRNWIELEPANGKIDTVDRHLLYYYLTYTYADKIFNFQDSCLTFVRLELQSIKITNWW